MSSWIPGDYGWFNLLTGISGISRQHPTTYKFTSCLFVSSQLLSQFTSDLQAEHFIMSVSKAPSLHMTTDEDMGRREYEDHYLRYPDIFKYV